MPELLFEIFCEEIPARMQEKAGRDLSKALTDGLTKAGLSVDDAAVMTGPRRLVFTADIPARSPDISEERKGPRTSAPEQALAGFLRGAGLSDISQAETRSDKKGEFYVAVIEKPGEASADILAALIPDVMNNFPWPKSMKSGTSNFKWVRPLTSMICLLGGKPVGFEVGGIASGVTTQGHRRMGRGPFTVTGLKDYKAQLEGPGHVVLDSAARKDLILTGARKACAAKGLELVEDEGLLSEVAGLAEYPVVILGDMDPAFLKLPGEVIRLSMRTHQKYFAVRDPKTGALAPNFIVVANQVAPDGGKAIAAGNSRVLSARLSDALFFEEQDAKQDLIGYYDKLDTVVFHQKLGSVRDKAERVAALAKELAPKVGADPEAAAYAAKLAKCDLVTNMVIEFTSLQGQIGRLMYEREVLGQAASPSAPSGGTSPTSGGGSAQTDNPPPQSGGGGRRAAEVGGGSFTRQTQADIALAIEEHYKPQGPSDSVPTNPVSVAVALADKLDTLVGFWAIDEKPTGSKDPYALRRAALGMVRIVLETGVRLDLQTWFVNSNERFPRSHMQIENLLAFILDRLKVLLRESGMRHDIIDAVFALGGDDLVTIVARTEALQSFLSTDDGANLLAGYKRAANILRAEAKKGELPSGAPNAGTAPAEQALFAALTDAQPKIDAALAAEDYVAAMTALSILRSPIDAFFDDVMVNSDEPGERENRLRLLGLLKDTASRIADLDKVDG